VVRRIGLDRFDVPGDRALGAAELLVRNVAHLDEEPVSLLGLCAGRHVPRPRRLHRLHTLHSSGMSTSPLRARVRNGRLVLDEPTDLPDGTEVSLAVVDDSDELDEEDRARLHAALDRADDDLRKGRAVPGEQVLERLERREEASSS